MENRRSFIKKIGVSTALMSWFPLSGVFGKSTKSNNNVLECDPTTLDYYGEGPFYTENAPEIENNVLIEETEVGERLVISGTVFSQDCETVIPGALLDIWHANDAGQYDNEGYNLRGKLNADDNGEYSYETILPGKYLNGPSFRPRHIHLKVSGEGFNSLTTQIYFEGDTDIPGDAAASIDSGIYNATDRIISLNWNESDQKWEGAFDVVMFDLTNQVKEESLHIHFGMINSCNPNPLSDKAKIRYSVFKNSDVNLSCFDLSGKVVSNLSRGNMKPGKYEISFDPHNHKMKKGEYILALQINGISVHHKKIQVV